MTTIAYDGKTLVADRRVSVDARGLVREVKIATLNVAGLGVCRVGAAGEYGDVSDTVKNDLSEEVNVMAIDSRGRVWLRIGKLDWRRSNHRVTAIGSGRDLAIGAMLAGADAAQAVRIASKRDPYSGDGVDTL